MKVVKVPRRYPVLRPLLFWSAALALCFPAAGVAGGEALFYIEAPVDASRFEGSGIEVWERFWIGEREVVVVSAPADGRGLLAGLGARSGGLEPFSGDEALFVVTAPRGIDLSLLSRRCVVIISGDHVALVRTDQSSAELLAGEGMEIERVMPPPGRAPSISARPSVFKSLAWDPGIQQVIDDVGQANVWDLWGDITGENSVVIGGSPYTIQTRNSYQATPIEKATQYCYEYFGALGLSASYHDYTWSGNNWRNVVAEQTGYVNPGDIYIICGHLDDMPTGALAPGADDNGSGSVSVLTAAAILSNYGFENTIRYVLFTGEEQGLQGSYYYVQDLFNAGENVLGALNFDMISYDGNADGVIEVHCGTMAASEALGDLLINTISEYSLSLVPVKITTGSTTASDHARFWNASYPAILGIEDTWYGATDDFNPYYHSVDDTRANGNIAYLTEYVKAAVGTTARLGVMVSAPTPTVTPTPTITQTPTITNTPLPLVPLAVMKNEKGDYNLYTYASARAGDRVYWDAVSRNPSPLSRDFWSVPSGNSVRAMAEVDADGGGPQEIAVLKVSGGFDQNLYIYAPPGQGDWSYWDARARNPSPLARDLWAIPRGNDTSLIADGEGLIAAMENQAGDYNLYVYNSPAAGDWTYWDCAARNPSPLARDLWVIAQGNDAVALGGLDTTGNGDADSLLVVRNVLGEYRVYLWNMPVAGDWTYADALARNLVPQALDRWVIPQRNDIVLVTGVNRGNTFDELAVMENQSGDYNIYLWNAPRPGDVTQAQAEARNPSPLARDAWVIPAGNNVLAISAPR